MPTDDLDGDRALERLLDLHLVEVEAGETVRYVTHPITRALAGQMLASATSSCSDSRK